MIIKLAGHWAQRCNTIIFATWLLYLLDTRHQRFNTSGGLLKTLSVEGHSTWRLVGYRRSLSLIKPFIFNGDFAGLVYGNYIRECCHICFKSKSDVPITIWISYGKMHIGQVTIVGNDSVTKSFSFTSRRSSWMREIHTPPWGITVFIYQFIIYGAVPL